MIKGTVRGQQLVVEHPLIVSDTLDYLEAQFSFLTSDWFGLAKWVHFTQGDVVYDIKLGADRVEKNQHLNLTDGRWDVYIHGNEFKDGNVVERITTNIATINVIKCGALDGEPFAEIPATVVEQIYADLDKLREDVAGGEIPVEVIENAVNKYLKEHPLEETDPNVYPWAKEPEKPKYTADEVGAEPMVELIGLKESDSLLLSANNKYYATITGDCQIVAEQPNNTGIDNTTLLYARFTDDVSVVWGSNVLFYNGEIPEIKTGCFDIIFTFEPNVQKWCIGVIPKGAVE
jgi:hypothetical protein